VSKINPSDDSSIVTVGKVWEVAEKDNLFTSLDKDQRLKRICLSFALFKLLRKVRAPAGDNRLRSPHLPGHHLVKGLYNDGGSQGNAEALFQVMSDEVTFLSEYNHSVVPVVLASPSFLLVNYFSI